MLKLRSSLILNLFQNYLIVQPMWSVVRSLVGTPE